jgi:glycosyltransferase involved in cell wall biosynthesis
VNKPRVLVAHCRYQHRGGEDSVAEAEIEMLEKRGHAVHTLFRHNDEIASLSAANIVAQTLWSKRTSRELESAVQAFRPDIIHVHNTFPLLSPSLYWAAAKAGVPVVQTLHNFRLLCAQAMLLRDGKVCEECLGGIPWRGVMRKCYRDSAAQSVVLVGVIGLHRMLGTYREKVTRYIALNQFCREKFIAGGLPAEKIRVKPNFVDIPDQPATERQGGLFVGRLSPEKGLDVLSNAVREASCDIDVIGVGPGQSSLEDSEGIRMLGWLEQHDIHARMRSAAYLVMPSIWYENFPRTLVEAFACGLPVIGSRLGALAELIEDGRTGLLFDAGSATDLARKLAWAASHPEEMKSMGRNARMEYEAKYTPDQNYRQLMTIYNDAIAADTNKEAA